MKRSTSHWFSLNRQIVRIRLRLFQILFLPIVANLWMTTVVLAEDKLARERIAGEKLAGDFFESKIRPVMVKHCYSCHSAEASAKGKLQAGLLLDSKAGLIKGGETGPVVVAGDASHSLLISSLRYESYQMPPTGKLPEEVIQDFVRWIEAGAVDPRDDSTALVPRREAFRISDADRRHWAFQPIARCDMPKDGASDWAQEERDVLIALEMKKRGILPSPAADVYSLLRRASFAVTGLPPSAEVIVEFAMDNVPDAYDRLVDRLMASPDYGVHWGRHWLDGIRYTTDVDKSGAYRDWVIRSLNTDMQYDRFVMLQLAGDLLPADPSDESPRHARGGSFDGVTATGMLAMAIWEQVARDLAVAEIVDSQIDLVGRQLMGLTLACARCHDHKYDPISTDDYYALSGVFFSSHVATGKIIADGRLANEVIDVSLLGSQELAHNQQMDVGISQLESRVQKLAELVPQAVKLDGLRQQIADLQTQLAKSSDMGRKALMDELSKLEGEQRKLLDDRQAKGWSESPVELTSIAEMKREVAALQKKKFSAPIVCGVEEGGVPGSNREQIGDARIYVRGEHLREGPVVPRRFPTILAGDEQLPIGIRTAQSGRLELAQWITSPGHPLTARVIVNRIWQRLMGIGLVRSPDNFGRSGDSPSHPQLLDHLAHRFVESSWSMKRAIRSHLLSTTYRQASFSHPESSAADPENITFHRFDRRRLTYEELRDSLLAVGDRLDRAANSVSGIAPNGFELRRTMFQLVERKKINPTSATFDGPDPKSIVVSRAETTSAPQALFLLNNQLVTDSARAFVDTIQGELQDTGDVERLNLLWMRVLGHPPDLRELSAAGEFLTKGTWAELVQALLCTNEFAYVD